MQLGITGSMATTWIEPVHFNDLIQMETIFRKCNNYFGNPDKTDNYNLLSGYECLPEIMSHAFTETINEYYINKGRKPKATKDRTDILAYSFRQSFLPDEIAGEKAHEIGYETALAITKGEHQFIVYTHIDKAHIHNHIIFCSVQTDATRKWYNPFKSHQNLIEPTSDYICRKHGLSTVEDPQKKNERTEDTQYRQRAKGQKLEPSKRKTLQQFIDHVIENEKPKTFDEFLKLVLENGAEIKSGRNISQTWQEWQTAKRAKNISLKIKGANFVKLDRLPPEYTTDGIKHRIAQALELSKKDIIQKIQEPKTGDQSKPTEPPPTIPQFTTRPINRVNLIIDIENSIKAQQSAGYERWAEIFNLKQMAEALIILQQNNIATVEELEQATQAAQTKQDKINEAIAGINSRQKEINELQKTIGNYNKTKDIFTAYKKSGYSNKFLEENRKDIDTYRQAQKHFTELSLEKIPKIAELQNEYRTLAAEKDNLYKARSGHKTHSLEMRNIKTNIARWLEIKDMDDRHSPDINTKKEPKDIAQKSKPHNIAPAKKQKSLDR